MIDRVFLLLSPAVFLLFLSLGIWDGGGRTPVFVHPAVEVEVARAARAPDLARSTSRAAAGTAAAVEGEAMDQDAGPLEAPGGARKAQPCHS